MSTLLIIGHTFPEPTTTAAGVRMMQLIELFKSYQYKVVFATTAATTEWSESLSAHEVQVEAIQLNDAGFDRWIQALNPSVVVFDRFITEEQFGWRVADQCPKALRILDSEDLHFLRQARKEAVENGQHVSTANLYSDLAKRELASILRSDLSLIISLAEIKLLKERFSIPASLLYYLPLLIDQISEEKKIDLPNFRNRKHFISVGNFQHAPNLDAVLWIASEIWPMIRKQLPEAQWHIYGAYAPKQIQQLHSESRGVIIKGWAPQISEVMQNARIALVPLRFGAGLKGKILTALQAGTPVITTSIGVEGIAEGVEFGGMVCDKQEEIVAAAVALYKDESSWKQKQKLGFELLQQRFGKRHFQEAFEQHLSDLRSNLDTHREAHFISQILHHHSLQSSKFMSKWIELKNKK